MAWGALKNMRKTERRGRWIRAVGLTIKLLVEVTWNGYDFADSWGTEEINRRVKPLWAPDMKQE